jgi:hypothetical protein
MGNEQSSSVRHELNLDQLTEEQLAFCGFRVLGIQEKSPASQAGFVSFFDFIVEANGIRLVSSLYIVLFFFFFLS